MHYNALGRCNLIKEIRTVTIANRMESLGIERPTSNYLVYQESTTGRKYLLNKPKQCALSELARRCIPSTFVEMVRGQTAHGYHPNKSLVPEVLAKLGTGYQHLDNLLMIGREGGSVYLKKTPPRQQLCPPNHGSGSDRVNILRKKIRKEQDACLVLDDDLTRNNHQHVRRCGQGGNNASISGRVIQDLSYPEGDSINDCTDHGSVIKPEYSHCDEVATEILRARREHPHAKVEITALAVHFFLVLNAALVGSNNYS
ncbi:LOW QUALITY PROTEIN: Secreted protein [Phytophthora palmivora]|uniref:Secreted protein n=1 Tax=Phytophthora palmivora TaxID=4796 RepID=A0A2P4XA18_9STRA|nr:LOW QUALITY PROTEIN: Secreted protein [Phytophthora palmivora]